LCGLQEFSRASDEGPATTSDEGPATTETKWRHREEKYQSKPNGGIEKKSTCPKLPKRGDILWGIVTPKELKSKR